MKTITLQKPIKINGKSVDQINFDFDKLTGQDMCAAETEYQTMGGIAAASLALSNRYCMSIAAKAANLTVDDILRLSAKDCTRIVLDVQNFLLDLDGQEDLKAPSAEPSNKQLSG
ncbi:MAG: phage tail assembly protein [Desulfobacteraceae bacterium]|nr:phage tail assembly protein [Desulfobacteraceae bacterium]